MQTRNVQCAPRYGRRAVLGLALAPLLAGVAHAEEETKQTYAVTLPPQPGDRFVFLAGAHKGQVVRLDDLAIGGPQVQVFPICGRRPAIDLSAPATARFMIPRMAQRWWTGLRLDPCLRSG